MRLQNEVIELEFSETTATMTAVRNIGTGETYRIRGDEFALETPEARWAFADFREEKRALMQSVLRVNYRKDHVDVEVTYMLGEGRHFVEKRVAVTNGQDCAWTQILLSEMTIEAEGLAMVCYRHPDFGRLQNEDHRSFYREPGLEPVKTYFGRTSRGGFFTGIEMPFDDPRQEGTKVTLAFRPNLRVKAGERFECEPVYFGVYQRQALDSRAAEWRPATGSGPSVLPLPSESAAMVAMTSAVLGPRRLGLLATACGWHCEMEQQAYTPESLAADLRALEVIKECGLDSVSDSHPWGGETEKLNQLKEEDRYETGPEPLRLIKRARELGLEVVQWSSMNFTHPWGATGQPFVKDKKEWRRVLVPRPDRPTDAIFRDQPSNCIAYKPFREWVTRIIFDALDTAEYGMWVMDGDFWGWGGYFHSTVPTQCGSTEHDHLPVDSNFASQRALDQLIAQVHERYPKMPIFMCRPPMDLGVWSQRNVDACFTIIETGTTGSNLAGGDEIRLASRIRVHHHFFPHYLDWPLLFPSYASYFEWKDDPSKRPKWPSEHIDYILLSALSCAPNLLFYLPARTGLPEADKATIRRWLDWGRANEKYWNVRRDLPDWPQAGKVDGSAHMAGDRGFVFLFNSSREKLTGNFVLNEESIGLAKGEKFSVNQIHPLPNGGEIYRWNEAVAWTVPEETAVLLEIKPVK